MLILISGFQAALYSGWVILEEKRMNKLPRGNFWLGGTSNFLCQCSHYYLFLRVLK